ncbi:MULTISPECIES: AAA family ATPase [Rhizobium/Agrobacterium group]|uniref:AAA family ATPase n=1 Tax=Rhizobium oryzihabitans TaxID=2267833 RepID=UPI004033A5C8
METLTDRVTRHLLKGLRHHAVMTTFHRAEKAGLLTSTALRGHPRSRSAWMVTDRARQILTGSPRRDWKIVDRLLRTKGAPRHQRDTSFDFTTPEEDVAVDGVVCDPPVAAASATMTRKGAAREGRQRDGVAAGPTAGSARDIDFRYIATCLAEQLPPPNPVHVAVVLLVARAIGTSLPNIRALTSALRAPAPFVLIKAPVSHFEVCLGAMLEDGLILPFKAVLEDVLGGTPLSGRFQQSLKDHQRRLRTLSGKAIESTEEKRLRRRLRHALTDEPGPIILVDETRLALTPVVTKTADIVLECDGFDHVMIAELLQACDGMPPSHSLMLMERMDFEPDHLSLDDIALAIRPGRSLKQTLSVMAMLADRHKAGDGETDKPRSEDRQQSDSGRGKSKDKQQVKPLGPDIEIIEPVKLPPEAAARSPANGDERHAGNTRDRLLLVETLSGYGAARNWAFDLKADLALWRQGNLRWDEMSTRLLLSGPPGTGKTMFARALCNTLQVPLLATSVADWLEPGFLGDVLQRMSGAFAFAAEKAPSILFIDEIDNIGSRQTSAANRSHDDYWTSMINRMLELLDGASRLEGVIVIGATNLPERIDPALLRSGRLETHIPIPMPDTNALVGILATHLGSDLEPVLASAPPPLVAKRLRPAPAIDSQPLRRGRPSGASHEDGDTETAEGPRHEDG